MLNKYQDTVKKAEQVIENAEKAKKDGGASESEQGGEGKELGKFLYSVDEVIINPNGTDGKRLLLTSVGFDINSDAGQKELKEKEILVKDIVISVLSSKNITQLNDVAYKDTLKIEIKNKMKEKIPSVKVNEVYFSKYIIQ